MNRSRDWAEVVRVLKEAREVALACHVKPDGDALGALLGATLILRKLGARTFPSWDAEPVALPAPYEWLPGREHLMPTASIPQAPVFVALDCGAGDRLGRLEPLAHASSCLINIDHHPGNDDFGHLNLVVPSASSTSELVARLAADLSVVLDRDIATCLYVGIVTDTGRFQHANTTPEALRLAADLLSLGVPVPAIAQELYESAPFGYLKLVGHVLERAVLVEEDRLVYSWLYRADLDETGVSAAETDGLIDAVRSTRAADVAVLFKEQPDGSFRVSLRSRGRSVGAVARAKGGGGHELAAGFTASDIDGAVNDIRELLGGPSAEPGVGL